MLWILCEVGWGVVEGKVVSTLSWTELQPGTAEQAQKGTLSERTRLFSETRLQMVNPQTTKYKHFLLGQDGSMRLTHEL